MPAGVSIEFRGAVRLEDSLRRVRSTITTGMSDAVGRRLALEGIDTVRRLTPRRKTDRTDRNDPEYPYRSRGAPFRDQWRLYEQVATENAYEAIIRNTATNTREGLLALASVEFGARSHTISPRRPGGRLKWGQSGRFSKFAVRAPRLDDIYREDDNVREYRFRKRRRAGEVIVRSVTHPGHQDFHFVQDTKAHLNRLSYQLLVRFKAQIEREFGPLSVSVR